MITTDGYFIADHPAWTVISTRDRASFRQTYQNGQVYHLHHTYTWGHLASVGSDQIRITVECWGPEGRECITLVHRYVGEGDWQHEFRAARLNPELYLMEGLL